MARILYGLAEHDEEGAVINRILDAIDAWKIAHRIEAYRSGYPYSEALYGSIWEWLKDRTWR